MRQRFIQSFSTSGTEREAIENELLGKPYIAYIQDGRYIDWNTLSPTPPVPVYSAMPLTFKIISGGTISWRKLNYNSPSKTIQYRVNGGDWAQITSNTGASIPSFSVNDGDVVQFRGNNSTYSSGANGNILFTSSNLKFDVEGNIMSLVNATDYQNITSMTSNNDNLFYCLFQGCVGLRSAENLILPATTLAKACYTQLFSGCTGLVNVPALPATAMTDSCYASMFEDCTSLTEVPIDLLPARALAIRCYYGMFRKCTSLTTAPELPATTLYADCYYGMFYKCTSLTTAPELPATTSVDSCYWSMFEKCSNLNYVKCMLFDPRTENNALNYWLRGVASNGTFVKSMYSLESWWRSADAIPSNWTVEDADI